jgi:uncharacterized protein (DUF58 family)
LEPGEARGASYRLPAARRGLYRLRALEVELCDPFGLAKVVRVGAPGGTLTVHPRIQHVPHNSIPSDSDRDRRVPLPVLGRGGDEFYGLREYELGDDLRRVHWASTARVDELIIRQPENLWRGRTTIVVDARAEVQNGPTFEASLSAAASLAVSTLRSGMQARVVLTGATDTYYGSGAAHEATILDTLALSERRAGAGLWDELRHAGLSGPLVLITTDATNSADIGAVLRRAGRASAAVVVFLRTAAAGGDSAKSIAGTSTGRSPGAPGGAGGTSRWRHVVVPLGGNFSALWSGSRKLGVPC